MGQKSRYSKHEKTLQIRFRLLQVENIRFQKEIVLLLKDVPPSLSLEAGVLTQKTPTSNAKGVKWWEDKGIVTKMAKVAPSILAADFSKLGSEIESVNTADYLHFDVMDGNFVPNISFGFPVLESVRKITDMPLDVHLMIDSPSRYVTEFAKSGSDIITFHVEAEGSDKIHHTIGKIHGHGKKAGLSIKPSTPAEAILPYIEIIDLVLVMTVEPGYGGQKFISEMLPKISRVRDVIESRKLCCELEVDGGINLETAKLCVNAGADVLVAGSDVFMADNKAAHIAKLQQLQK